MRTRAHGRGLLLAASLLFTSAAAAQEFGLDLTSEGPDLRPSIAFLGVTSTPENAEAAVAASQLLEKLSRDSNRFARVLAPAELQQLLGDGYADALTCAEAACLTGLSHRLSVDRLLRAELTESGLTLHGYDWGSEKVETLTVDPKVLKPARGAEKRFAAETEPLFRTLGTVVGSLKVSTNVETAEIRWGGRLVGTGTEVKTVVAAGTHPLTVSAPKYKTEEYSVTVTPAGTTEESVTLEAAPEEAQQVAQSDVELEIQRRPPSPKPLWERPGTYVAAAGVAVLAIGLGFGASANGMNGKLVDANNDGVLDVTRAQAQSAQLNATLANVFGTAGALMIGGGGVWMFLDSRSSAGSGGGVFVHGSF